MEWKYWQLSTADIHVYNNCSLIINNYTYFVRRCWAPVEQRHRLQVRYDDDDDDDDELSVVCMCYVQYRYNTSCTVRTCTAVDFIKCTYYKYLIVAVYLLTLVSTYVSARPHVTLTATVYGVLSATHWLSLLCPDLRRVVYYKMTGGICLSVCPSFCLSGAET